MAHFAWSSSRFPCLREVPIWKFRSQIRDFLVSVDFLRRDPTLLNMTLHPERGVAVRDTAKPATIRDACPDRCNVPDSRFQFCSQVSCHRLCTRSRRTLTLPSSTPRLLVSSTRTSRDGGLPSTRQRSSTVSTWCNLRGHCPSTRPGNSEVLVSQTSRHHEAFPCRIDLYASRPSTMPHLASAWNVQSPSLQMPTLVGRATDSPVSLLMTSLSLDDSRPTHHNVVPPNEFQVTHLIDSCCPNQAAEPRWEHNVHLALPTTHGTILFKTTAAEQSPNVFT